MTIMNQASTETGSSLGELIKTRWLNPRRKRFWAIVVILLYTLLGFFAAPLIIKNSVVGLFRDDLGRVAQIAKVEVNPYVLSLSVQGFAVSDKDDVRLVAFDEFFVNFQLSSLFNWAWTFSEIRLTGPYFYFERFATEDSRLDHLLADFATSFPAAQDDEKSTEEDDGAPRLLIQNLSLNQGHVDVKDNLPGTAVETKLSPINISIQELNTLPDRHGQHAVTIRLPDDASLKWSGSLTLAPLDSEGELVLEGLHLDPAIAYLKAMLPLESFSAKLSSRFQYRLHLNDDGQLDVDIDELETELDDLLVSGLAPVTEFVDIPKISLKGGKLRYPEQSLHFSSLAVENPKITAWVNENGSLSVMDLIPEGGEGSEPADTVDAYSAWQLGIGEFILENGKLALTDRSINPIAAVGITDLQVKLSEITNKDDALMPLDVSGKLAEGGNYNLNGSVGIFPEFSMSGTASIRGVPLALGQPYVQQFAHIELESGVLDSDIELAVDSGSNFTAGGSLQIPGLEINDTLHDERLLGWDKLDIDHFDLNSEGLHISQMVFEQAFGRFVIHEDLTTNLAALLIEQDADVDDEVIEEPITVIIGGIRVDEGAMDFADFSLPLPFATHIAHLDGTISIIATNSNAPANIRLEGQVDEYGLARIEGSMNMLDPIRHTDVTVEFRNLLMSSLSPYTVQFAGREIDEGKMDLGLVYRIEEGQLHGENDVVISDLVLGKKVEHPDAASLPLGLAVGLLKDADGVIKIDLPVEGDINDPGFKIGGVIWQAISGMITKIVSAPFRLLGQLIGIESEDLGQFEFLAGRYDLTPPELEKVVQLEQALQQRPELAVEISGVTDPKIDVPALKLIRLRSVANERLAEGLGDKDENAMMLDVEIRAVVELLFTERFPDIPPESLKITHTAPPADDPEGKQVLDELAYATDLWKRLLESEVISEQDLADLATARAEVIKTAFLANGQFDGGRIVITETQEVESEDGEWVKLELAVASD
jgi:uncharacterized protein involved in outer membrane biogenesis